MAGQHDLLTLAEAAVQLRCSKAHVSKLVNGKVRGAAPLPAVHLGRRILIRLAALDAYARAHERAGQGGILQPLPEVNAVDA
jgi:excisionase family DNA binding protein